MKRAVIYARYSSDKQREESIDAQVRACKDYCIRKHYLVTKVYADEAKSGRDIAKRDAYNQMIADAAEGKFDIIIFHKIDRNCRNEFNYYTVQHTLARLGVEYAYAVQPIDNTPEGKMNEAVFVAMAAYYSRNLAKETKKGLNENAYKALFNGGRPPLGYKIVDQHYEIEPREAEAVRLIFDMYLRGSGYMEIAAELNRRGFVTRSGGNFGKNSLYDILGNEKYIGIYTFNKTARKEGLPRNMHPKVNSSDFIKIEDALPAIISKENFAAVQEMRKVNKHKAAKYAAKATYLLSGKIFCGCCGSAMTGHRVTTRGKYYYYYTCNKKDRVSASRCPQKQIQRDAIEECVLNVLQGKLLTPGHIKIISKDMAAEYAKLSQQSKETKSSLNAAKIKAERKLDNLYKLIEDGVADERDWQRFKSVKRELNSIDEQIKALGKIAGFPVLTSEQIIATLKQLKSELLRQNNIEAKKMLINLFVEKVIVEGPNIHTYFNIGKVFCSPGAAPSAPFLQKLIYKYSVNIA